MGDYADDAIDQALNSMLDYDCDGNGDDWDFSILFRRRRLPRRRPTSAQVFKNFVDKPIDYSQF